MDALWTASEIAAVTRGTCVGTEECVVTGISIDTRTIENGDLFIPLHGPNFDGHDFLDMALEKGATCALAERGNDPRLVLVKDSFTALQDLAEGARARSQAKVIAVTGSVGKTSVKAMLDVAFSAVGQTHASSASLNNHWGVPLSLARMPRRAAYAVFEIGMNHAGEITPLSKLVAPHLAIITTVAPAHIAHFASVEAIALAKAEIFQGMDVNGIAVLPRDNAQFPILLAEARTQGLNNIITFGTHAEADIRLVDYKENIFGGDVVADVYGKEVRYALGVPGVHHAVNSLSVLAALQAFGVLTKEAVQSFAAMSPVSGRGNRIACVLNEGQSPLVILDDTHNASPIAVEAALQSMVALPCEGKRIIALGDMLELGNDAEALHAGLAAAISAARPDLVLLAGPLMESLFHELKNQISSDRLRHFPDSTALANEVEHFVAAGDVILLKGSHGSYMTRVRDALLALCHVFGQGSSSTPTSSIKKTG